MSQIQKIQLIPYHLYGVGKYTSLGLAYKLADTLPAPPEKIKHIADLFLEQGIPVEY